MALHWSTQSIFYMAAIPALITALAMFGLRWAMSKSTTSGRSDVDVIAH